MQESNRLGDLTLSRILADAVGSEEKAEQLLTDVQDAINKQIEGDELKRLIFRLLCKYDVPDVELCHVLYRSQVITK